MLAFDLLYFYLVFAKSVILEESGVFVYREETITLNYTSNGSYSGPHGFVLEYYTGMLACCIVML